MAIHMTRRVMVDGEAADLSRSVAGWVYETRGCRYAIRRMGPAGPVGWAVWDLSNGRGPVYVPSLRVGIVHARASACFRPGGGT